MSRYSVQVTDSAFDAISAQARYLVGEAQATEPAQRWLERVWDAVDSFECWPRRGAKAEEDDDLPHEVRQVLVGSHILLFTVDEGSQTVWIIGLRHGRRMARPGDLPPGGEVREGSAVGA